MLYPQRNEFRQFVDLSGFWDFRFDFNNIGLNENWNRNFDDGTPIAVPASWNDQFAEHRDFLGPGWYKTTFIIPRGWKEKVVYLRFGSINYIADVWLNGEPIGTHEGGHLPFEFIISNHLNQKVNLLVVRVDGKLTPERVPPGGSRMSYPSTNFDFFPFCGIHRPVLLYCVPKGAINDIIVSTEIQDKMGIVNIIVDLEQEVEVETHFKLRGDNTQIETEVKSENRYIEATLNIEQPNLWSPESPYLYNLTVELIKNGAKFDSYHLKVGIRTVEVKDDQLLLNGQPIYLYGFGRHVDFPVTGRGYLPPVIIKDYSLMKWIGANSFRTTHYPYSEQMMDLADRLGILVIDEIPAVGLTFSRQHIDRHLNLCKQYIQELIARDKNHPSVIIWSLANEPHASTLSKEFFRQLYELTKTKDPTRLVTLVNMMSVRNKAFEFLDLVCLNRYYGWYTEPGEIEKGVKYLSKDLDKTYKKFNKPIILSEYGADTIPGWHAHPPEMFSEEYQVEFLTRYIELLHSKKYIVGQHVWNLCDFKTSQGVQRVGAMNYKGVFTRDRRPKMAAHLLRKLWDKKGK